MPKKPINRIENSRPPVPENGGKETARKIIVLGNRGYFSNSIINHSVNLADRLNYDLVAVSITDWGVKPDSRAGGSLRSLIRQASESGIRCDHLSWTGEVESEIEEIIRELRRVELVVMDEKANPERIQGISTPVVSVLSATETQGGTDMSADAGHETTRMGLIARTAGSGLLSAGLYAAVFTHSDSVMHYFTRGNWFAALPIATVFVFSFAHGYFAHNLWSLLGIQAIKQDRVRETERKVIEKRKTARKRPRMYAYVNPFHRIDKH